MSPAMRRRVHREPWVELVVEIVRGTPRLNGAACVRRPAVFDAVDGRDGQRTAEALALCRRCSALPQCRRWVAALPKAHRPRGVVAGLWLTNAATVPTEAADGGGAMTR